ncbi:S46 family peptidase [Aquisphaera insulae]|uniref:S46 family peptidase n=1 Tax=Aquisphaera insulae TaxID=2712864 RepID=UPI0013E9BE84|nr:S46 family peptidase [Aquisphaera insulae]
MRTGARHGLLGGLAIMILSTAGYSDEGMWVFNNLPLETLKAKYDFVPPPGWADHLRSSAVRFNSGGSGSFVSADGLIMTNHHVGADTLAKLSNKEKDYYRDGFFAKTREEEVKAPDLELNVLVGIEDVTARVNAAIEPGQDDASVEKARRKAMAEIEKESTDRTGLRSDVVTLYQGGQYHLYTFKKYTDVRLVFAPEFASAFFGGDPDNFEYPRYDLDVCFFRAYEDGKPARPANYLKWSKDGAKAGELVFVAGHPGRTDRLNTLASLHYMRDQAMPVLLDYLHTKEAFLLEYGKKGPEAYRQSKEDLFSIQNSRKARVGGHEGLRDESFMARKAQGENELRSRIAANPEKKALYDKAWDRIAKAQEHAAAILRPYSFLERGFAFDSDLFRIARILVRLADEKAKPNSERLKEFRESGMASLELRLFSDAPIYPEYEEAKLAQSLAYWKKVMPDHPLVEQVLRGRSPEAAAHDFVSGSKLAHVPVRKKLAAEGKAGIAASDDPMIKLALAVDADARAVRKEREDKVESVEATNYALIARALFEDRGDRVYPDATFTLRLAFGTVKGYGVGGKTIPPFTTMAGAFQHADAHGNKDPYVLPESWHKARESGELKGETPLNFVSTADIIGGNSGSPVVNRNNEVVGLIFDGNIQSLVLDFGYDDKVARAVSVDSRGIVEALRSIYKTDRLVKELTGE